MADREQPYDPYIPSGGAQGGAGAQAGGNQRTAALQAVRASFRLFPLLVSPRDDDDRQLLCRTSGFGNSLDAVKATFWTPVVAVHYAAFLATVDSCRITL